MPQVVNRTAADSVSASHPNNTAQNLNMGHYNELGDRALRLVPFRIGRYHLRRRGSCVRRRRAGAMGRDRPRRGERK